MTATKKGEALGTIAALIANLIFGFSFLFSKLALKASHPLIVLSSRFTIAFLLLNILLLLGIFKLNIKGKKIGKLVLMSLCQPLLYFIFELYGLKLTSSAISGIIIALVPVGVTLFSGVFLKERPTAFQIICSAISLLFVAAVSLISNNSSKTHIIGIILLVGAVITAAAFNILSRGISGEFSPFERTYFMFLVSFFGFNFISLACFGGDYVKMTVNALCQRDFIVAIIYLSVLSSVAAFFIYNYSTTKITAIRSSSFSNIITVVSVLAGILILKEEFSALQLLFCIPIILGVWGVNRRKGNE